MTITYAPREILRKIDNALLAQYAKQNSVFQDIDFSKLKQTEIEPIYDALLALEEKQRDKIEQELRRVAALADKRKIELLFSLLLNAGCDLPEFEKKKGFFDKAMWAWLYHHALCEDVLFFSFEDTQRRYWHKFPYPAGNVAKYDKSDLEALNSSIREYFQKRDGRAKYCRTEHHYFSGSEYLICYPSEYPQEVTEWTDKGEFDSRRPRRTAFEVVFVFQKNGQAVDVYTNESIEVHRELFEIWAEVILSFKNIASKPKRSYNLRPFHTRDHNIIFPQEGRIKALKVYKIRFAPAHNPKCTHTIECDVSEDFHAVYIEMERKCISISHIKSVGLEITLQAGSLDKTITKRFDLSSKSCSLRHEDEAAVIRSFLKQTGIDETQ